MAKVHAAHLSKPLLKARLSEKQWEAMEFINTALQQEYNVRRDMILKRLDVTIQSFKWSDRVKVCTCSCVESDVNIVDMNILIRHIFYSCSVLLVLIKFIFGVMSRNTSHGTNLFCQ